MRYLIYTESAPCGSALPLSHAIHNSTNMKGLDAVRLATAIFCNRFKEDKPLVLDLITEETPTELMEVCGKFGVMIKPM